MDKKIEKPIFNRFRWGLGMVLCILVFVTFRSLPTPVSTQKVARQNLVFSTARVSVFEDYLPLRAHIEPYKSIYLDAVEGGRVEKIFVEEGDYLHSGQDMLKLSNTALQLDIISREAQVSEQLNNLRNTKLAIEQHRLHLKSALADQDYQIQRLSSQINRRSKVSSYLGEEELALLEQELEYLKRRRQITQESQQQEEKMRLAQIEQLEKNVVQLEKNLALARSNLDNLLVKAPHGGLLSAFNVEIGETKMRGERLGQIDDTSRFKASGMVSEFYLNKLALGQRAEVLIGDKTFLLELVKIYPEIRNNEFEIELKFIGEFPKDIRRGQSLRPRLLLSERESLLLVDNGSFMQQSGGQWAFVVSKDGKTAHKRDVVFGRKNPNQIEIKLGLSSGETIVVSSYKNLLDLEQIILEE